MIREGLNGKKKTFSFGHCPNHLNPALTPIRATWSFFSDVKIQDLKEGDILRHPGTHVEINMRNQYMFAHCASSQVTNCLANCPSKKCSLISGPWIPKSDLFSDAQPNMAGGSNWGKIWRWIFQRSNYRGSVPLPLGSLLIVLGEQTCARFSGGPRKCCIIVARNHFCCRKLMALNGDKGRYDLHTTISENYF